MRFRHSLVFLILLLLVPATTWAQDATMPELDARLSWERNVRLPGWTELAVTLTSEVNDWDGELLVLDKQQKITYRQDIDLPAHSRKQYRIPIYVQTITSLELTLKSRSGAVSQQTLRPRTPDKDRICGIVDITGEANSLADYGCAETLIINNLQLLPETPMVWDTVDLLLINGAPTAALNDAQREALLAWVSIGGHLLLGGGPTLPQTLDGLPETLRIAQTGNTFIADSLPMDKRATGSWPLIELVPKAEAQTLLKFDGATVAVHKDIGLGQVEVVGWNLNIAETHNWLAQLWETDAIPAITFPNSTETYSQAGIPNIHNLTRIPTSAMPRFSIILLLFPIYILLIGPGTWMLSKKLGQPIIAWVLMPVWIVLAVFTVALQLSSTFSGTFPLINEIAVITVPGPNLPARIVQSTAIYAPRTQSLEWQTENSSRPLKGRYNTESIYSDGDPFDVDVMLTKERPSRVSIERPLGIITWGTEGTTPSMALRTDLSFVNKEGQLYIEGILESEVPLYDMALELHNRAYKIPITGTVSPGMPFYISQKGIPIDDWYYYDSSTNICNRLGNIEPKSYYPPTVITPQNIGTYIVTPENSQCFLSATTDSVPTPTESEGAQQIGHSCIFYAIPCPQSPQGMVTLNEEFFIIDIENGWSDDKATIDLSTPDTILNYTLPEFLQLEDVESLTLEFEMLSHTLVSGEEYPIKIALWDWEEERWISYSLQDKTWAIALDGDEARKFLSPATALRVRLTPRNPIEWHQVKVNLMLEGIR